MWADAKLDGRPAEFGRKANFAQGKILSGGKSPQRCIYNVAAQETAKRRAKFGWPPVSDVAAVTKTRRNPLKFAGASQTNEPVYLASRMQHISDMHSKFTLRPHRMWNYGKRPIFDC